VKINRRFGGTYRHFGSKITPSKKLAPNSPRSVLQGVMIRSTWCHMPKDIILFTAILFLSFIFHSFVCILDEYVVGKLICSINANSNCVILSTVLNINVDAYLKSWITWREIAAVSQCALYVCAPLSHGGFSGCGWRWWFPDMMDRFRCSINICKSPKYAVMLTRTTFVMYVRAELIVVKNGTRRCKQ
jgi:hypothetical protein